MRQDDTQVEDNVIHVRARHDGTKVKPSFKAGDIKRAVIQVILMSDKHSGAKSIGKAPFNYHLNTTVVTLYNTNHAQPAEQHKLFKTCVALSAIFLDSSFSM